MYVTILCQFKSWKYLDSSHMKYHFPNFWSMQIFFYLYDDKVLILTKDLVFEQNKYQNLITKKRV